MGNYEDMLELQPPEVPEGHVRMSLHDRAAQFSPFAALTGFEEQIAEATAAAEDSDFF